MKRIVFSLFVFALIFFGKINLLAGTAFSDVKIIHQDDHEIILEWRPQNFQLRTRQINGRQVQIISFENAIARNRPGQPDIPYRILSVGLPSLQSAVITVLNIRAHTVNNVVLAPVPVVYKDRSGISREQYVFNDSVYQSNVPFPQAIVKSASPAMFRDLPLQSIRISPVQFNAYDQKLTVYDYIRIKITFQGKPATGQRLVRKELLDDVARAFVLNFDQARKWRVVRKPLLKKAAQLPSGPYYRITVKEDGLYKVTAAMLEAAGIRLDNIAPDQVKLFGNGGHELSYNTNATQNNPLFTQQIPILVFDVNQNNRFDGNDYVLFYGKNVNGWFYDESSKTFKYQEHKFATENYYWLNLQDASKGLRMEESSLAANANSQASYFTDRYHFEQDLYNLLASGPDWYGYRFFGLSGSLSQDVNLKVKTDVSEVEPKFVIQLKGGSGIHWTDQTINYRYNFKVALNNNIILKDVRFSGNSRIQFKADIPSVSYFRNGKNTLDIQYTGNVDGCSAYLDYFELYYPRGFEAEGDQLTFYAAAQSQAVNYTISGLSNRNDYYIFDITRGNAPRILAKNVKAEGGKLTIPLNAASHERRILVISLASPKIKTVAQVESFTPRQELLSGTNQADYLVVTHKSFLPYAQKIADMHADKLTTRVVCMEDIYFYFNGGVPDPTALRNFIRYAYYHWSDPAPSYVLFFGDAHYDYRNINIPDTLRVPTWEIYSPGELSSRCTDDYLVDINYTSGGSFSSFTPDIANGRIPVESVLDCQRIVKKLDDYFHNSQQDGWQTNITMVADDQYRPGVTNEWEHQNQSEHIAEMSNLRRFIINRVYLSLYPSVPGGFTRVKPEANNALIDYWNQGTLIVNYVGHGSPTQWAHEGVLVMDRDYPRINNEGRLCFLVAATCDFGKFDDPNEPSFTEALIWMENRGIVGAMASTRVAYSSANFNLAYGFFKRLFPDGGPSIELGKAKLQAVMASGGASVNDQKYILFGDPAMHLIDAREKVRITQIDPPDTLKALSKVTVSGEVLAGNAPNTNFNGEAVIIVHDATYDSVKTGSGFDLIKLIGPRIFKGQVDVTNGRLTGSFIIPKSIRYVNKPTGRLTLYAYNPATAFNAMGYNDHLLINGSESNVDDARGPEIDVYFKDQENFTPGDIIPENTILIVELYDEHGINITGETGHNISLQIDDNPPRDISGFFAYEKNSFQKGKIEYPLNQMSEGEHQIKIQAFDNLNNISTTDVDVKVAQSSTMLLTDVVNYPNPFKSATKFTFQTNVEGADVTIKIYTATGRLIQQLEGVSKVGYNDEISWDGTDRDGDEVANGVYLYKIILKDGKNKKEKIEKLVVLR